MWEFRGKYELRSLKFHWPFFLLSELSGPLDFKVLKIGLLVTLNYLSLLQRNREYTLRYMRTILTVCWTSGEWTTVDRCSGSFWSPAFWIGATATRCNLLSAPSRAVPLWVAEQFGTWIASLVCTCRTDVLCPNEAWLIFVNKI